MPETRIIFRLPNSSDVTILAGNWKPAKDYESLNSADFYFSRFNVEDESYFLEKNNNEIDTDTFWKLPFYKNPIPEVNNSSNNYPFLIQKALNQLKSGELDKVVLSASETRNLSNTFDLKSFYNNLLQYYPKAFVYCLTSPKTGTWLGASPEILLCGNYDSITTVALAGTLPSKAKTQWTSKEKEEQKMVEEFIGNVLTQHQIPFSIKGPETITSGNLIHLQSTFNLSKNFDKSEAFHLAKALHPTPAIAGLPREKALNFITENEEHQRSFYAGVIGSTRKESIQLFVNLRCMQWHGTAATLYAGAGITKDSNPEAEWVEIKNKMNSLSRFF